MPTKKPTYESTRKRDATIAGTLLTLGVALLIALLCNIAGAI